jgi:hypothetical protein
MRHYSDNSDTDFHETGTGMQIEIKWSKDETMVTLSVTNAGSTKATKSIRMSSLELDDLRSFINARMQ